jgi:hypothetical protein
MASHQRPLFRFERAQRILPELQRLLRTARDAHADRKLAAEDLKAYRRKLVLVGGANPNRNRLAAYEDMAKTAQQRLKLAVDEIQNLGIEIKDVERGLADFPSRFRGRPVYLCYELGEECIAYWHDQSEGYGGRKPIDAEFLAEHEGDFS